MKRTLTLLSTAAMLLAAGCGGSSSPTAPSRTLPVASSATSAVALSTSSIFGTSAVDLASCLRASSDPACFSGSRRTAQAVGSAVTAPSAPGGLSATASGSTVTLTWTAPGSGDPVVAYVIEAGSSSGAADLASITTGNAATTFTAAGVGAGTYYVRVRALTAGGVSGPPSNEAILRVGSSGCTTAPNAPGGLGTSVSGSTLTITWVAPAGGCPVSAYILQAGTAPGLSNIATSNTGNTATSFTATGAPAGTYYVRVLAANAFGLSAASNEGTFTIGSNAPPGSQQVTFVGLVSNGDGLIFPSDPTCGVEKADLQLALNVLGNAVTGTATSRISVSPGGQCGTVGSVGVNNISGTVSGSTLTFSLIDQTGHANPGTAVVNGTRMTGSIFNPNLGQSLTFSANQQ
jgi:hypothetical protein